jgi:hypothetical protein
MEDKFLKSGAETIKIRKYRGETNFGHALYLNSYFHPNSPIQSTYWHRVQGRRAVDVEPLVGLKLEN